MIIGSHTDKAGRTWKLEVNAKGAKHEWHAIVSDNPGLGYRSVYATGAPKYVAGKWKQLKRS